MDPGAIWLQYSSQKSESSETLAGLKSLYGLDEDMPMRCLKLMRACQLPDFACAKGVVGFTSQRKFVSQPSVGIRLWRRAVLGQKLNSSCALKSLQLGQVTKRKTSNSHRHPGPPNWLQPEQVPRMHKVLTGGWTQISCSHLRIVL